MKFILILNTPSFDHLDKMISARFLPQKVIVFFSLQPKEYLWGDNYFDPHQTFPL